ncbi:hypothetical protein BOTBODRAFT_178186 [Botryobasidium botryosum FD-172 SS1]|uniref:Uncharacterized protein n=1 Tax=Botryobasidium botryosum (strain FD-172 SS1) TaxID=930990 RepID=A0A067MG29_BOTB1|nr:hypothetical protein BOTBODRAFT_178186 [Botryobasidium botryosum FD-172 SS1]
MSTHYDDEYPTLTDSDGPDDIISEASAPILLQSPPIDNILSDHEDVHAHPREQRSPEIGAPISVDHAYGAEDDYYKDQDAWGLSSSMELGPLGLSPYQNRPSESPEPDDPVPDDPEAQEGDFDAVDANDDPLYVPVESLYDNEPLSIPLTTLPPAFKEHPAIRNAYIRIFISHAFNGSSHTSVRDQLETIYWGLHTTSGGTLPKLDEMVRTLGTLERRLGIATSAYIQYHFLCPVCWFRHPPDQLYKLCSPNCTNSGCPGVLYTVKQNAAHLLNTSARAAEEKRVPTKIFPCASLEGAIQRILLRPGKWEEFQHWRCPGDEEGRALPIPR